MWISAAVEDIDSSSLKNVNLLFSWIFDQELFWSKNLFYEFWGDLGLKFAGPVTYHKKASFNNFKGTIELNVYD